MSELEPFTRGRGLARVTEERPPFRFAAETRVGFDETDAQGVVYYGRYLPYFDRARVEYLRHLGLLDSGPAFLEFVMRATAVEYLAPAFFDDLLEVYVRIARLGRTSVTYEFAVYGGADDAVRCTAAQTVVQVNSRTRQPAPIDVELRRAIAEFERFPND